MQLLKFTENKLLCVGLIGALLLSGCSLIKPGDGDPPRTPLIPLPTGTIAPTPTPNCPPISDEILTSNEIIIVPNNVIFLFDLDYASQYNYEMSNGNLVQGIYPFLNQTLLTFMDTGDRVSQFRTGFRYYEDGRIDRQQSDITIAPDLPSTPEPLPKYSPYPTIEPYSETVGLSGVTYQAMIVKWERENELHIQEYADKEFDHRCDLKLWTDNYEATAIPWEVTRTADRANFLKEFTTENQNFLSGIDPLETELGRRVLLDGLSHVTVDIGNTCEEFSRCVLVIVDEFEDYREKVPDYMNVNLVNVEIIGIMPHCEDIYQPNCLERQEIWKQFFSSFEATSVVFTNGENLEEFLKLYIAEEAYEGLNVIYLKGE